MAKNKGGRVKNQTIPSNSPPRLSEYERNALHELRRVGVSDYQIRKIRQLRKEVQPYEQAMQRQSEKFNVGYKNGSYSSFLSYLKRNLGEYEHYERYEIRYVVRNYAEEVRADISSFEETGYSREVYSSASDMARDISRLFDDYGFDLDVDADTILNLNTSELANIKRLHETAMHYDEIYNQRGDKRYYDVTVNTLQAISGILS